jgi:hypothetical protein
MANAIRRLRLNLEPRARRRCLISTTCRWLAIPDYNPRPMPGDMTAMDAALLVPDAETAQLVPPRIHWAKCRVSGQTAPFPPIRNVAPTERHDERWPSTFGAMVIILFGKGRCKVRYNAMRLLSTAPIRRDKTKKRAVALQEQQEAAIDWVRTRTIFFVDENLPIFILPEPCQVTSFSVQRDRRQQPKRGLARTAPVSVAPLA